jgi:hypothetical protein
MSHDRLWRAACQPAVSARTHRGLQRTTHDHPNKRAAQTADKGKHMSKIRLTKMALAGVLVVATATPIAAQTVFANGNGNRHLSVFTGTGSAVPPPPSDLSRCGTPFNPANRPCVITSGANDHKFTGAFVGEDKGGAALLGAVLVPVAPATLSVPFVLWGKPTGTVEGCGTGSFIIQVTGNANSTTGEWEIIKDSGTGDLLTLRGSGTFTSVTSAAGVATDTYTGRLRCGDKKYGRGNHDD